MITKKMTVKSSTTRRAQEPNSEAKLRLLKLEGVVIEFSNFLRKEGALIAGKTTPTK